MEGKIVFATDTACALQDIIKELAPSKCALIYPEQAAPLLFKTLNVPALLPNALLLPHAEGEEHKSIEECMKLWSTLLAAGMDRKSLIINMGGGITTDMGGFVASTYMRGIRYINIPTTLLAMVDASCGGKTGVNLDGVKNIIGSFALPQATIISSQFLTTLPVEQIHSGWAEMVKHSLLSGHEKAVRYLHYEPDTLTPAEWSPLIEESVIFKKSVTDADPKESGRRRILNFGHTAGHAFEAFYNANGGHLIHGNAVALGMLTALVLSHILSGFNTAFIYQYAGMVKRLYTRPHISCSHYDELLRLMHHDKKNRGSENVNFVLLSPEFTPIEAHSTDDTAIRNALDITRDLLDQ